MKYSKSYICTKLAKFEHYLILNSYLINASRLHIFIPICIIIFIVNLLIVLNLPISYQKIPDLKTIYIIDFIFYFLLLIYWQYKQYLISTNLDCPSLDKYHKIKQTSTLFFTNFIFNLSIFFPTFLLTNKISKTFFDAEILQASFDNVSQVDWDINFGSDYFQGKLVYSGNFSNHKLSDINCGILAANLKHDFVGNLIYDIDEINEEIYVHDSSSITFSYPFKKSFDSSVLQTFIVYYKSFTEDSIYSKKFQTSIINRKINIYDKINNEKSQLELCFFKLANENIYIYTPYLDYVQSFLIFNEFLKENLKTNTPFSRFLELRKGYDKNHREKPNPPPSYTQLCNNFEISHSIFLYWLEINVFFYFVYFIPLIRFHFGVWVIIASLTLFIVSISLFFYFSSLINDFSVNYDNEFLLFINSWTNNIFTYKLNFIFLFLLLYIILKQISLKGKSSFRIFIFLFTFYNIILFSFSYLLSIISTFNYDSELYYIMPYINFGHLSFNIFLIISYCLFFSYMLLKSIYKIYLNPKK